MFRKMSWVLAASLVVIAVTIYQRQEVEIARLQRDKARIEVQDNDLQTAAAASRGPVRYTGPTAELPPPLVQPRPPVDRLPDGDDDRSVDVERSSTARWEAEARASQVAVEDGFAAEVVDPAWAPGVAGDLRARLGAIVVPPSSSLGDVECRRSICRVEMVARDHESMKRFMDKAFGVGGGAAWTGSMMAEYQPPDRDGATLVVLYLGRDGTAFPRPAS